MSCWADLVDAGRVRRHVALAAHTTYKLGGPADYFAVVEGSKDLVDLGRCLRAEPMPVLVVGRGSNLLVSDTGFAGLAIHLGSSFGEVSIDPDGVVVAGAAVPMPRMARAAGTAGRGGLEWCVGIPGSVGGAVRQNAGCFGSDISDVLVDATVVSLATGERAVSSAVDLDLSYRHSSIDALDVVVAARFATTPISPQTAAEEMRRVTRWRKENQPGGTLNAGSVFKNPPGGFAGEIIERVGLKGFEIKGVRVSPRHGNFIEAEGGSSAEDVKRLIETVRQRVQEVTGVLLEPEIQMVGFGEDG